MTDVTRVGRKGHNLVLICSIKARKSPMRFLITGGLFFCLFFFAGCGQDSLSSEDLVTTWLQEAHYFRARGDEALASHKAHLALEKAQDPLNRAQCEMFLYGHVSGPLPEGYEGLLLQAKQALDLSLYKDAYNLMDERLASLYDSRSVVNTKSLGIYQHRLAMREVQLAQAELLASLGRNEEAQVMLERAIRHKSWTEIEARLKRKIPLDESLIADDHVGHTASQFAHLTEMRERALLQRSWTLAFQKGFLT